MDTAPPDIEPLLRDVLVKGDPKAILSLLLTLTVMILRDHAFAKVTMKNRLGDALRWLGSTHGGGVLSSIIGAGLGAVLTALSTKTTPSPSALLNVFFVAAGASGFSTWSKLHKHKEDKAVNNLKNSHEGNDAKQD